MHNLRFPNLKLQIASNYNDLIHLSFFANNYQPEIAMGNLKPCNCKLENDIDMINVNRSIL